jgi:hypothetical protein
VRGGRSKTSSPAAAGHHTIPRRAAAERFPFAVPLNGKGKNHALLCALCASVVRTLCLSTAAEASRNPSRLESRSHLTPKTLTPKTCHACVGLWQKIAFRPRPSAADSIPWTADYRGALRIMGTPLFLCVSPVKILLAGGSLGYCAMPGPICNRSHHDVSRQARHFGISNLLP